MTPTPFFGRLYYEKLRPQNGLRQSNVLIPPIPLRTFASLCTMVARRADVHEL